MEMNDLFCSVPGEKFFVWTKDQPAILCSACALCCQNHLEVFEIPVPYNGVLNCDCGNERCGPERFCYFIPDKGNSNNAEVYNFAPGVRYYHTAEDDEKWERFRIDNPHLLLKKTVFFFENKRLIEMIYGVSHVVSKNPQYLSSVLCERVLDVGPILGLMTQVQEDFLKIIENLQSWDILPIAAVVYHCFRCSDEIFRLAKIEVADNAKGDLSMLIDHFKLTFSFVIKEALDKKAASFKVIKVFSYAQGLYYLKHVAGRRETKASIFLGNFYDIEYDWMKLLLRAGRRGFYMYLCSAFEVELSNVGDEKRERIGRYLVKNRNT